MKKSKITFLLAELFLVLIAGFFIRQIFQENVPQKRVAVILSNSGDKRWDGLVNGLKQSADANDVHLIICNTDDIETAQDEKELIDEQLENDVDAFIICPAPGEDTSDMLGQLGDVPFVLITQDAYSEDGESGFVTIKPDNYKIGYTLGEQIKANDVDDLSGKSVGIITGYSKTEGSVSMKAGLMDAIDGTGCEVSWVYSRCGSQDICGIVNILGKVDYMVVMDTYALDELGENADNGRYNGAQLYGMGTSMKSVALLNAGKIDCLVIPDSYSIGYASVNEIAGSLKSRWYTMKSQEEDIRTIYRDDLFSEDVERFLYSYE